MYKLFFAAASLLSLAGLALASPIAEPAPQLGAGGLGPTLSGLTGSIGGIAGDGAGTTTARLQELPGFLEAFLSEFDRYVCVVDT